MIAPMLLLLLFPLVGKADPLAVPLGYSQFTTGLSSSTQLSPPASAVGATRMLVCVETGSVRWRDDGTAPTSTVGMPIPFNGSPCAWFKEATLSAIQFIQQVGTYTIDVWWGN
jgi:hypothetical protein